MLKYILLGFLNYRPHNGYDLKQVMEMSTRNFWHADLSQIYKTLKSLEKQGKIISSIEEQQDRPDRRVYTITETGRTELLSWLASPMTEISPMKEILLLKVFFASKIDPTNILMQLHLQRELHRENLERYLGQTMEDIQTKTEMLGASETDMLFWESTRRAGILYEEVYIQWLDETIARIEAHTKENS